MQSNERFRFSSVPKQVLSKGKHINSGSLTAETSSMTALLPMPSPAYNNLSLKIIYLMLKRTICIERKRDDFMVCLQKITSPPPASLLCSLPTFP